MKKLVIAGGTGFIGTHLIKYFESKFDDLIVLSRSKTGRSNKITYVKWNGELLGTWTEYLENADVLINLSGKSVDCRFTEKNKKEIMSSRVESTSILGKAISQCKNPPALWINAASAAIYGYSETKQMTEEDPKVADNDFMIEVCNAWEKAFDTVYAPYTRKITMRTTLVLGNGGGVFPVFSKLVKFFLGGKMGSGKQMVSALHIADYCRIVEWFIENKVALGAYNITVPVPLNNEEFMRLFRKAYGVPFGLPATEWMIKIGAFIMGTEGDLVLKSLNVIPERLLKQGFEFKFRDLGSCLNDLASESKR